jgi:hypothetical protein
MQPVTVSIQQRHKLFRTVSPGLAIVSPALGGVGPAPRLLRVRVGSYAVVVLALRPETLALAVLLPQLRVVVNDAGSLKFHNTI